MVTFEDFHEVRLPTSLSFGAKGGISFYTQIQAHQKGQEGRVMEWSFGRHEYDISHTIRTEALFELLQLFQGARRGRKYGFRFKDDMDFMSSIDGGLDINLGFTVWPVLGIADGATTDYQLIKLYTDSAGSYTRALHKPVEGTVQIIVDGTPQVESSDYDVDYSTGLVTFLSPPGGDVNVQGYCEFDVPVRFKNDQLTGSYDQFQNLNWNSIGLIEVRPRSV